jgi:pyruvate dehydrogenase E2 component (dihydrolipoamide acetyltransferase)
MSVEVRLPQWGMGMQEGTVLRWLKREGDPIQADEDLVEIEAAKTTQAVTAPVAGVLLRVLVPEGKTIPVRTALALVGAASEVPPSHAGASPEPDRSRPPSNTAAGHRVLVTPVARKLARDLGVDLELVTGSGPGGRIDEADIRAYAEHQRPSSPEPAALDSPAPPADRMEPMSSMRRAIARNMHASLQTMAQLTLFTACSVISR